MPTGAENGDSLFQSENRHDIDQKPPGPTHEHCTPLIIWQILSPYYLFRSNSDLCGAIPILLNGQVLRTGIPKQKDRSIDSVFYNNRHRGRMGLGRGLARFKPLSQQHSHCAGFSIPLRPPRGAINLVHQLVGYAACSHQRHHA